MKNLFFEKSGKIDMDAKVYFVFFQKLKRKNETSFSRNEAVTRYAIPKELLEYSRTKGSYYSNNLTFKDIEKFIYMKIDNSQII